MHTNKKKRERGACPTFALFLPAICHTIRHVTWTQATLESIREVIRTYLAQPDAQRRAGTARAGFVEDLGSVAAEMIS
jgi:predicted DNA-binding protein (UPF0251 family)